MDTQRNQIENHQALCRRTAEKLETHQMDDRLSSIEFSIRTSLTIISPCFTHLYRQYDCGLNYQDETSPRHDAARHETDQSEPKIFQLLITSVHINRAFENLNIK